MNWTTDDIPNQTGRVAVVTGANAGLGFETARALARAGAHVVMACRSPERGEAARESILPAAREGGGALTLQRLDLGELASVREFADRLRTDLDGIDLLVNNAGLMAPPEDKTADGFEIQYGVNFLGHFALTSLLIDRMRERSGARVVTLSSLAHYGASIDFDNLRIEKGYRAWREYGQSKLACLLFTIELQRRLEAAGWSVHSLGAHPGFTHTDLQRHSPVLAKVTSRTAMGPAQGALPILYAATAPGVKPGGYYGPDGLLEIRGYPSEARIARPARDRHVARRLWEVAERQASVTYPLHVSEPAPEPQAPSPRGG